MLTCDIFLLKYLVSEVKHGAWPEETFEATMCSQIMDVGEAWWCVRRQAQTGTSQLEGVFAHCLLPKVGFLTARRNLTKRQVYRMVS